MYSNLWIWWVTLITSTWICQKSKVVVASYFFYDPYGKHDSVGKGRPVLTLVSQGMWRDYIISYSFVKVGPVNPKGHNKAFVNIMFTEHLDSLTSPKNDCHLDNWSFHPARTLPECKRLHKWLQPMSTQTKVYGGNVCCCYCCKHKASSFIAT